MEIRMGPRVAIRGAFCSMLEPKGRDRTGFENHKSSGGSPSHHNPTEVLWPWNFSVEFPEKTSTEISNGKGKLGHLVRPPASFLHCG